LWRSINARNKERQKQIKYGGLWDDLDVIKGMRHKPVRAKLDIVCGITKNWNTCEKKVTKTAADLLSKRDSHWDMAQAHPFERSATIKETCWRTG